MGKLFDIVKAFARDWQKNFLEDVDASSVRFKESLKSKESKAAKTDQIKRKIILCLREPPDLMFGQTEVYVCTRNHKLVHDIAKEFGVTFEKRVNERQGYWQYQTRIDGIYVEVYGIQQILNCRLVAKEKLVKMQIWEIVCDETT